MLQATSFIVQLPTLYLDFQAAEDPFAGGPEFASWILKRYHVYHIFPIGDAFPQGALSLFQEVCGMCVNGWLRMTHRSSFFA